MGGIAADAIPELPLGSIGADTQHLATREMEDPTLHDELPRLPYAPAFDIHPPSFELEAERLPTEKLSTLLRRPLTASREPILEALARSEANGHGKRARQRDDADEEREQEPTPERQRELLDLLAATTARSDDLSRSLSSRQELVRRLADPTLSLEEAALLLDVCPTTVRRYTNRGVLKHFRTEGNQRRFRLSDILEFLERRSRGSVADAGGEESGDGDD
jgi:excisionase family DNA binding protein